MKLQGNKKLHHQQTRTSQRHYHEKKNILHVRKRHDTRTNSTGSSIKGAWESQEERVLTSIGKTLERYQRCSYTSQNDNDNEHETQNWYQEMSKLKAKYESLQKSQRQLLGEDLGPLNIKELQNLEKQLEGALAQARQRKTQIMIEQMEELRKKELHLGEINKQLRFKLESDGFNLKAYESMWNTTNSATVAGGGNFPFQPSETNTMDCQPEPFLQIGYQNYVQAEQSSAPKNMVGETSFIQGWML
ncbi:MADS-box transcription factor 6-like protein [Trifolium pratense]|uniref:MADS-box transcription factor 6-like protein n=1 Tax=Trifolium pratense TaxID=57577 RepID=A0A2K3NDC7_TRIPR|nr:MADS-box transcription factor 6-like protein [Trifolium pratense]